MAMTDLQRFHAELRAALILAGKEIRKLNFELNGPIAPCWPYFAVPCGSPALSRAKMEPLRVSA
jgi:hypothetical protein